jgi:hypothetical protein
MRTVFEQWIQDAPEGGERERRQALRDDAVRLAEEVRDRRRREKTAIAALRAACPGFDDETYSNALGYGYFVTR